MKVIHKYPIKALDNGPVKVKMPEGAKIISVLVQDNEPVLYAIVDPINEPVYYDFYICYTGIYLPSDDLLDRMTFVVTFQIGSIVVHLFEVHED